MTQLDLSVNTKLARRALSDIEKKQLPFATALGLNWTAKDFQDAERSHIERAFTLRRKQFVKRTVKINRGEFADKRKPVVRVHIDESRDFLAKFEQGGRKRSRTGGRLAVPIEARKNFGQVVPKRLRIPQLNLRRRGRQVTGAQRTFVMRGVGIFQQVGRGKRARKRLLYIFKRDVPIPASLRFRTIARATVEQRWRPNFEKAFAQAMRTAR